MTARSFGEIAFGIAAAKATRSFQPVRRNSYCTSDRRSTSLWRPLAANKAEARRIIAHRLQAAQYYDRKHKEAGKWNGPLGAIGLEVLRELYRIVDFKTGRLEPAIATICRTIRRSKQAVVNALVRLKEHGFLDWIRRSEPVAAEGAGPRIRQVTNAYGFGLPRCAAEWVARKLGNGPGPDCEIARVQVARADFDAMLATLPCAEQAAVLTDDLQMLARLSSLGAAIDRNSASLRDRENPALSRI